MLGSHLRKCIRFHKYLSGIVALSVWPTSWLSGLISLASGICFHGWRRDIENCIVRPTSLDFVVVEGVANSIPRLIFLVRFTLSFSASFFLSWLHWYWFFRWWWWWWWTYFGGVIQPWLAHRDTNKKRWPLSPPSYSFYLSSGSCTLSMLFPHKKVV